MAVQGQALFGETPPRAPSRKPRRRPGGRWFPVLYAAKEGRETRPEGREQVRVGSRSGGSAIRARRVAARARPGDFGPRPRAHPPGAPPARPLGLRGPPQPRTEHAPWPPPAAAHVVGPGEKRVSEPLSGPAAGLRCRARATQLGRPPARAPRFPLPEGGDTRRAGPPRARRAPWRLRRGRAQGARGGPSGPPYARSGPPRAVSPGSGARAAPFSLAARESRDCGLPWGDAAAVPALRQSARLVAWFGVCGGGVSFLPGMPLPPYSSFPAGCEKMPHARTYLFILQQLQDTMKLFKNRGNARSSRAVVVFNEPLGPRAPRPARPSPSPAPQPAPLPGRARRRGHCFWSLAGGARACRLAGAVRWG